MTKIIRTMAMRIQKKLENHFNSDDHKFKDLLAKATQGDSDAQNSLSVCYFNGEGIEKDEQEDIYWLTKSAEQGEAKAQGNLGD